MKKTFRLADCSFSSELRYRQVLRGIGICGIVSLLITAKLQEHGHLVSIDFSAMQSLFAHTNPITPNTPQVSTYTANDAVTITSINNLLDGKTTAPSGVASNAVLEQNIGTRAALPLNWSMINGSIKHSFTDTALRAGLTKAEVSHIKLLLSNQIDFNHFKTDDHFSVLLARDPQSLHSAVLRDILAIEIVQRQTTLRVFQYHSTNGTISYYEANGHSLNPGFLRYPTHSLGIGSGFSTNRLDPITGHYHSHPAIDFRAPMGTPIVATGSGRINFMSFERGYGNVVKITHPDHISTLYAHMKGFAKGLHKGSLVKMGQVIGYVGMTGYATGPHVHYEFRIKGVPYNDLTVKLPTATPLTGASKQDFLKKISVYQRYFVKA